MHAQKRFPIQTMVAHLPVIRPETKAAGECPRMNNFLSHNETVWIASRI